MIKKFSSPKIKIWFEPMFFSLVFLVVSLLVVVSPSNYQAMAVLSGAI
jgi:hypothetical protein